MIDTKLKPRQIKILDILSQTPIRGVEIANKIKDFYPMSKATLMREMTFLISQNYIKVQGKGKNTVYISSQDPFLKYIDIEEYFKENSPFRVGGIKNFKLDVVNKFKNAFSNKEKKELNLISKKLSEQKKKIDPSIFKREIERFTIEFAWKSSKIEGNTYSLLETEILIKQMKEAVGHTKYEALMILNHKNAIDFILQNSSEFRTLTLNKIFNLHNILTKDLEISSGIRKNKVVITGTEYMPLSNSREIENALEEIIKTINTTDFPLTKALITVLMIAYLQPFVDGNKRTGRTLANALLIAYDLYPLSYRDVNIVEYVKAMLLFYETNNIYHFKQIFVNQFYFSVNNYFQQ
ncbi:Fic family protein [Candidatus Gottesmanbacteria bacterium]|nr:Fic family protein [Candidatus Gottesmanbacteria bacterium]